MLLTEKGKERIIFVSSLSLDYIDENIKTYQNTTNFAELKEHNKEEHKEDKKEDNYEKISILDLLGDDF